MINDHKELRWIRILLTIVAIPVIVVILKALKSIFIPLVFAIFLSFVFAPLNNFLRKKRVHISVVMLIMIVIIVLLMFVTTLIVSAATSSLITGFPRYQDNLLVRFVGVSDWIHQISEGLDMAMVSIPTIDFDSLFSSGSFSLSKTIANVMTTTVGISWNLFLVVVFLMFIVAQDGRLATKLKAVLSEEDQAKTNKTMKNIQGQIQRYLLTKTVISLLTAFVGMILMLLYGVEFVLVCGILLFILNFIPNIGSIIASAIPIVICYLQSGFDLRTIFFSILIVATQMMFGNVIEPKIQGERLNLSPIMVLISLIFWGWVWGITGMVLAVPITSAINIVLIQLDDKNLISAIISG